jgi:GNAT superfamily N-acetyltransferase
MRSIYFHRFLASPPTMADVSNMEDFWYINRINVPEKLRGRGYGRQLLNEIIADADADRVVLVLDPLATGGLHQDDLERWYLRNGFEWSHEYCTLEPTYCGDHKGRLVRKPKK